jgi:1-acyl-sn-glycerol-3-phosphate acyltransferase
MLYRLIWPPMKLLVRALFGLLGGLRRQGVERVPRTGGVLICPNHVSDADPGALAVALPRNAWFMAKEELFAIPVLGTLLRLYRVFPVRRNTADRAALRRAEALLKAGEVVVIFPESAGNPEATLQPLNPGAALLALRTGAPVIPVALADTQGMWPYGRPLPRRSGVPVSVTFGPPLDLSDLAGRRGGQAVEMVTQRLTEALAAMLGQPIPTGRPQIDRQPALGSTTRAA